MNKGRHKLNYFQEIKNTKIRLYFLDNLLLGYIMEENKLISVMIVLSILLTVCGVGQGADVRPESESSQVVAAERTLTEQGWQDLESAKEEVLEGLSEGFSLWWILLFFFLAVGLMLWLMWQNRHGMTFMKSGGEPVDILARRMFGPKHGVVCIRLREREFLLGIGGDNITLLSEWRTRPVGERTATEMPDVEKAADNWSRQGE